MGAAGLLVCAGCGDDEPGSVAPPAQEDICSSACVDVAEAPDPGPENPDPGSPPEDIAADPDAGAALDVPPESDSGVEPVDVGPDPVCEAGEPKGECSTGSAWLVCNADGTGWEEVECAAGLSCFEGSCGDLKCAPGALQCADLQTLQECQETEENTWVWQTKETCTDVCVSGECTGGCPFDLKLGDDKTCVYWPADFKPEPQEKCTADALLVVPSSASDQLAVFDIALDPPMLMDGSPFATCGDPSRVLLDPSGDVIASCRKGGKVQKHAIDGAVLWSTQMGDCNAARGITLSPDGRLFAACSSNGRVYELEPETGSVVAEVFINGFLYGITADADGIYVARFAGIDAGVVKITLGGEDDLKVDWTTAIDVYGIAVDGKGSVWIGGSSLRALDTLSGDVVDAPGGVAGSVQGVAVGPDGTVYGAMAGQNQVIKVDPGGTSSLLKLPAGDNHPRGAAVDAVGNVYTVNLLSSNVTRFDAVTEAATNFGAGALNGPYGYSGDMTGVTAACITGGGSTVWKSPKINTGKAGTVWLHVNWLATIPAGTSMDVTVRVGSSPWQPAESEEPIGLSGATAQVRAVFTQAEDGTVPTLHWMGIVHTK